jgi:hypothetical protein
VTNEIDAGDRHDDSVGPKRTGKERSATTRRRDQIPRMGSGIIPRPGTAPGRPDCLGLC